MALRRIFKRVAVVFPTICSIAFLNMLISSSISQSMEPDQEPMLQTYNLPEGMHPSHLDRIDIDVLKEGSVLDIDTVHRQGQLHCGTWQYVVSSDMKVLLIKRSANMVACPSSYAMAGEHSAVHETPKQTAVRCIEEELGEDIAGISTFDLMFRDPLYFYKDYGRERGGRKDLQLTYLWLVRLQENHTNVKLSLATEIESYRWISINELQSWLVADRETVRAGMTSDFCNEEMQMLLSVGLDRLYDMLKEIK